jgi:DNA-directed RNA polymerase subunit K/omega
MKRETRATDLDVEKCIVKTGGNRFDLILMATVRTRELKHQSRSNGKFISVVDSLLEAQTGNLNRVDYIAKIK